MSELEDKLGAVLSNPQLMDQIMQMANSLSGQSNHAATPQKQDSPETKMPLPDLKMLNQLSQFAGQGNIDSNQQSLLCALEPYLSHYRLQNLEKAMRAAKIARLASSFLNSGGLSLLTGR